ncbi:MAG: DUF11 domain-containing protein [Pseudomonadales bacterium]|nr:DUF11 domain-containing protein [Pseudomonadales bacterium]
MRQRTFIFASLILLLALLAISLTVNPVARADGLLQDVPRLDGYKIYFTEDNGEASRFDRSDQGLSRFAGLLSQLGAELETLEWRTGIPSDADLIVIAGPTGLNGDQIARLWAYLNNNQGRILLLAGPPLGRGRGIAANNGLFGLMWADMGVRVRDDVAVVESSFLENASPDSPTVVAHFVTNLQDPNHPITANASGELNFFQARSLELDISDRSVQITPLVFSANNFYGETNYNDFLGGGEVTYDSGDDTTRSALVLAAALEDPALQAKLVVVGDRDFAVNGIGLSSSPPSTDALLYPENARFLTRAAAWLLDADPATTEALTFGVPGPTATPTLVPTPVVLNSDVEIALTANNLAPQSGDALIYRVTVTNNGPDPANDINVAMELPGGITYVLSNTTTRGGYNLDEGTWAVGNLNVEDTAELFIVVIVDVNPQGTEISATANITDSDSVDSNADNDSATTTITVNAAASLAIKPIMVS